MNDKKFGRLQRLIHWAIAFTILFILLTISLRLGWMNKDFVASIIQSRAAEMGIALTPEQAVTIAKAIRKPMWDYHILAGYVMIGLYVIRMGVMLWKGPYFKSPFSSLVTGKEKLQSSIYVIFYVLLTVTLVTGFLVVNGPEKWKDAVEDIHVLSLYYVLVFIVLHLGGVFLADSGSDRGIISRMISGNSGLSKSSDQHDVG